MEDWMARRLGSILVLATTALFVAAIGASTPASSGAAVSCTYNDGVGLVTVEIGAGASATVIRDGDFIEANGQRCVDGVTEATVASTEVINIVGGAGGQRAVVSLTAGRFEPGRTDEVGTSDEIEIFVNLGGGPDSVKLSGRNQRDTIVVGRDNDQTRINLNAGEGDTVDYDLSVHDNVRSSRSSATATATRSRRPVASAQARCCPGRSASRAALGTTPSPVAARTTP
jgi:hypothetical protein